MYPVSGGPRTGNPSDRYISLVQGGTRWHEKPCYVPCVGMLGMARYSSVHTTAIVGRYTVNTGVTSFGGVVEVTASSPRRLRQGEDRGEEVVASSLEGGAIPRLSSSVTFYINEGGRRLRPSMKNAEPPPCR
ncbi:hypothetical protein BHM03_00034994 [Ensete ventricosum]|nr:hypothetical protein BHM03_00034994 [Ensete ventricosum]